MTSGGPFTPLDKQLSVAETISAEILNLLRQKELRPGDKLPPERELADILGVSRPSLREALRALSIMKIVEVRQGDGTYVTALKPEELVEHLEFVFLLDDSTMQQLFEARKIVEVGNAALAAQRITDDEIAALEDCQVRMEHNLRNSDQFLRADVELHEIVTSATRNPMLQRFMASVHTLGSASRQRTVGLQGMTESTIEHHRQIIAALKDHDPEAASAAMLRHLEHVESMYQSAKETAVVD
jgi:GntR family transcriptional repressor for pyruvate dehydrogenase complex